MIGALAFLAGACGFVWAASLFINWLIVKRCIASPPWRMLISTACAGMLGVFFYQSSSEGDGSPDAHDGGVYMTAAIIVGTIRYFGLKRRGRTREVVED